MTLAGRTLIMNQTKNSCLSYDCKETVRKLIVTAKTLNIHGTNCCHRVSSQCYISTARIAEFVEYLACKQWVSGSSPSLNFSNPRAFRASVRGCGVAIVLKRCYGQQNLIIFIYLWMKPNFLCKGSNRNSIFVNNNPAYLP